MANNSPIFVGNPNIGRTRISGSNTASDGTGTIYTFYTAGPSGSRVDSITFASAASASAASSAMVGKIFMGDIGGTSFRIIQEVAIGAVTRTNAVIGATQTIDFVNGYILPSGAAIGYRNGFIIPSGSILGATITVYAGNTDQMDVIAKGGDF